MSDLTLLLIKIGISLTLILGSIWYVSSLRNKIESQRLEMSSLTIQIKLQNESIENAGNDKKKLEDSLNDTSNANRKLQSDLDILKGKIDKRPPATSCEEAMIFLSDTAASVAKTWNEK